MIPILINNRDILDCVRHQVAFFKQVPGAYIVICDQASTYKPLLQWYASLIAGPSAVGLVNGPRPYTRVYFKQTDLYNTTPNELFVFPENLGPRGSQTILHLLDRMDYYFMSDADMDYTGINPHRLLPDLAELCQIDKKIQGAGVGIRIDDLPKTEMAEYARVHEAHNWENQKTYEIRKHPGSDTVIFKHSYYDAPCDTAGVLRPLFRQWDGGYTPAIRSAEHVARHLPWYFVPENWKCPRCRLEAIFFHHGSVPRCPECRSAILVPPDFQHFYKHASGAGTCYTARITDKTRPSIM